MKGYISQDKSIHQGPASKVGFCPFAEDWKKNFNKPHFTWQTRETFYVMFTRFVTTIAPLNLPYELWFVIIVQCNL